MPALREQRSVQVTAGDTLLLGANMRRKSVIIGSPKVATVWLTFIGPAAVGVGLPMRPGTAALVLNHDTLGDSLMEEIRAISDGVTESIGVVQVFA